MRAPGPPVRFLIAVIALWVGGRALVLTQSGKEAAVEVAAPTIPSPPSATSRPRRQQPVAPSARAPLVAERQQSRPPQERRVEMATAGGRSLMPAPDAGSVAPPPGPLATIASADVAPPSPPASPLPPTLVPAPPRGIAAASPPVSDQSRWSGSAFLFVRRGGSDAVALAGGGQLGASQAGARIAYRLDQAGRFAAAARAYVPTGRTRGAEAAVGIDLRPAPEVPLRLSIERRIAIGRDGRDAWSAYVAGGFFRGLGRNVELDGYAQAGLVGAKRRDAFADGALRIARAIDVGGGRVVLAGVGAWGAAQPGAARLDLGPRVALRLPAAGAAVSIAGEWRARVAGGARPGSGPTLTVAADF